MIFHHFSNDMIFPCMEIIQSFSMFQSSWELVPIGYDAEGDRKVMCSNCNLVTGKLSVNPKGTSFKSGKNKAVKE